MNGKAPQNFFYLKHENPQHSFTLLFLVNLLYLIAMQCTIHRKKVPIN